MPSKSKSLADSSQLPKIIWVYCVLFCVWAAYRLVFKHIPIYFEETIIKGAIFSLPLFFYPLKVKFPLKEFGLTSNRFFESVYLGILLGLCLGLAGQVGNMIRHQQLLFSNYSLTSANIGAFLILSLITAFWEQLTFSGYFLSQLKQNSKSEIIPTSIVGLLFSLIHLPALIFIQHVSPSQLILSLSLLFTLGMGCAILRLRQNNLIAPIMAHALWGVTIFMFR